MGREGYPLRTVFSETGRAGLCFLRHPGFLCRAHTLARRLWLPCWEVVPVLTLPKAASHYFTTPGKKPAQSFCASPRGSYLPLPPHSAGRARDRGVCTSPGLRACLAAFLGPGQSYTSLSACSCREKSKSASPCLQGLGAAGIPSLLISPPELFIHSFFYRGLHLRGTSQVDVSQVCSLSKLTCSMKMWLVACPAQLGSWAMVTMKIFGPSMGLSMSPLALCSCLSAWNVDRGHSVGPRIAIVVGYLSGEQSGGALQPGHLGQLEHSSS